MTSPFEFPNAHCLSKQLPHHLSLIENLDRLWRGEKTLRNQVL